MAPTESTAGDAHERLCAQFGAIDVYLFDQLLRGAIRPGLRVLDAGCGGGRNLVYLLQEGYDVTAVDVDPRAIRKVQALGVTNAHVADLGDLPYETGAFDVVLCNAVLHFAEDHGAFRRMALELGRVLAPGGLLWARLASSIGIEDHVKPLGEGCYVVPDGTERYLVDEAALIAWTEELGCDLADPIKTTNVQGLRCMTTWVLRKRT